MINIVEGTATNRILQAIVKKLVRKKLGINPDIDISNLNVETIDDQVYIHLDAEIRVDEKDIMKLITKGKES